MSLPSVAKEKTSNKISLVTRPSVTLVQSVPVASRPTLIYVQSIQTIQQPTTTTQQPIYITTKINKPKSLSQPVTIAPIVKTNPRSTQINKFVAVPSTSSTSSSSVASSSSTVTPNRFQLKTQHQTFQLKAQNLISKNSQHLKPTIVGQTIVSPRILLDDKPAIAKITKVSTATPFPQIEPKRTTTTTTTISTTKSGLTIDKFASSSSSTNATASITSSIHNKTTDVDKLDPVKLRYRTILENLLQLKNNFIRRTITQAIQQKLANQSNEDLLNVIFKSFELTLLSVNVEQIYLNVS